MWVLGFTQKPWQLLPGCSSRGGCSTVIEKSTCASMHGLGAMPWEGSVCSVCPISRPPLFQCIFHARAGTRRTDPAALPRGGLCSGPPLKYRIPLDIQMCRPMLEMWVVKVPGSQADTYFPQSQKTVKMLLPTHSPKQGRRPAHSKEVLMDPQAWQCPRVEAIRYPWCAGPLAGRKTAPGK